MNNPNQELELQINELENAEQEAKTLKLPEAVENTSKSSAKDMFDVENMTPEELKQHSLRLGHIPKEEFKGDLSRWKDEKTFLKETYEKMPALRNVIKTQKQVIDTQNLIIKRQLEDTKRLQRQLESEKITLSNKVKESLENGDLNQYHYLQEAGRNLDLDLEDAKQKTKELEVVANKINEESAENQAVSIEDQIATQSWLANNPAYKVSYEEISTPEELKFRKEADKFFRLYKENYPTAPLYQIYKAVDNQLLKAGLKRQAADVYNYTPPNNVTQKKTKDYESLTPSAKRACDKFVANGLDREAYINNLDEESFSWFKN